MDIWDDFIDSVEEIADEISSNVTSGIGETIDTVQEVYEDVSGAIGSWAEPIIDEASQIWDNVSGSVEKTVTQAIDGSSAWIEDFTSSIGATIDEVVDYGEKVINDVWDSWLEDTEADITHYQEVIDWIDNQAEAEANQTVKEASALADQLEDSGARLPGDAVVLDVATPQPTITPPAKLDLGILSSIFPGLEAIFAPILEGINNITERIELLSSSLPGAKTRAFGSDMVYTAGLGFNIGQEFSKADVNQFGSGIYDTLVATAASVGSLVGAPLGLLPIVMDAYSASLGAHIRNRANLISTPGRLGVNELAAALWRGYIEPDPANRQAAEQGLDQDNFNIMIELARQLLGANETISLMLRGEITETQASDRLGKLGYNTEDTNHIKTLAYQLPGIQDLVRMGVREVFSPEIAEKYGQFEDYPEQMTLHTKAIGLSEEWSRNFWAAHWELPSASMGFEMLHRGVIDEAELKTLLRTLDVMPYWRDKLIAISYSPFTRVDIRRMHKLGILDESAVKLAYKEIGYNDDKATKLTAFTLELNAEDKKIESQAQRDLSKSMITSAYQDGSIDDSQLQSMISDLGYDPDETDLIVLTEQYTQERRIRIKELEIIKMRVMYAKISLNTAIDQMNKIGLAEHERRWHILDLQMDLEIQAAKAEAKEAKAAAKAAAK